MAPKLKFVRELPPINHPKATSKWNEYIPLLQERAGLYALVQGPQDVPTTAGQTFRNLGCYTNTRTEKVVAEDGTETVMHTLWAAWPTEELTAKLDAIKAENKAKADKIKAAREARAAKAAANGSVASADQAAGE